MKCPEALVSNHAGLAMFRSQWQISGRFSSLPTRHPFDFIANPVEVTELDKCANFDAEGRLIGLGFSLPYETYSSGQHTAGMI